MPAQLRKPLGKILEEMNVVTPDQVRQLLQEQLQTPGKRLGEMLIERELATSAQVSQALAVQFDMKFVDLSKAEVPADVIQAVPKEVSSEKKIIPIARNGRVLTIAMSDPLDLFTLDDLRFILNTEIECVLATKEDIQDAIGRHYGAKSKTDMGSMLEELGQADVTIRGADEAGPEGEEGDDAPVIKLVQLIISEAVKTRASDIHVEPLEKKLRIRYRVDGVCFEVDSPPKRLQGSVLSRIKIMAMMDISEKRKTQDGRINVSVSGRELDIRVSALPASHGESIVMRLLDKQTGMVPLEDLGFHPDDHKRFKAIIKKPNGIVLVTGPTGSGKTTTLYAALRELNRPDVKIITAENPVEYVISGVNQCHVREHIGFTFARIIRAMLRQAPNIILVGEIRDKETSEIAVQAALTGHLVFSTLHTNDACSALTRLLDMGVKPFLVASSVQAVMGQRLVRMLCPNCKQPYKPEAGELSALGMSEADCAGKEIYKAAGCDQCKQGYRTRKGIFELLELNSTMREMVFSKAPLVKIEEQARMAGMVTLLEDGVRKVLAGITTVEEILMMTHREDITYT